MDLIGLSWSARGFHIPVFGAAIGGDRGQWGHGWGAEIDVATKWGIDLADGSEPVRSLEITEG